MPALNGEKDMNRENVFFWLQDQPLGNFGDALTLLFLKRLFAGDCLYPDRSVHLVGSVITPPRLRNVQKMSSISGDGRGLALFWGCGKKDALPLPREARERSLFLGVRGTHTRDALGLPRSTPLGDSAFLIPKIYHPRHDAEVAGKILWVPHLHHADPTEADLNECPDFLVKRPAIPNTAEACEAFIDAITSARFVMANAMHAAVIALAYGIPFAFWSGSGINVPFKWTDLTSAFGMKLDFFERFHEGQAAFDRMRPDRAFAELDLAPLLGEQPYALRDIF